MTNLSDKQLLPKLFVGGIGLVLLGIGIGGLASLQPTLTAMTLPIEPVMESNMMRMMDMMTDFTMHVGSFGTTTTALYAYLATMLGIYVGLIAIGGYIIYRAVAPLMKVSVTTT